MKGTPTPPFSGVKPSGRPSAAQLAARLGLSPRLVSAHGSSTLVVWPSLGRKASKMLGARMARLIVARRSEEHTSELQSLMRISYDDFCLKKKQIQINQNNEE